MLKFMDSVNQKFKSGKDKRARQNKLIELCESKMVPTCVVNPLQPLGFGFRCFMITLKKYKKSEAWREVMFRP